MGTQDSYTSMYIYIYMYMYIGFPLSIINVVLINVVITLYTQEWSRTPVGPQKTRRAKKKRSEKPNVLKFCVLDREYLPTTSILNTRNCGHVPGNNQGFSRSPFSCLSCLISMSQEVDLPHFEQIPVIVGIAHILLAMGPSSYYWYHSSGQTRMVLKA